jgi:uncharacterized damage-inducible protein DinB
MDPAMAEVAARLEDLHNQLKGAIKGLPAEALDWVPAAGMNSLGAIIVHVTGGERSLIGGAVGGNPEPRDRNAEFQATGRDEAALTRRLDEVLANSRSVLETLTAADLPEQRAMRADRMITVAFALYHAIDHTGIHTGHAQVTRQLWDSRQA